ncbi:MAG: VWA domain-containing protein, partial [Xanthomonadales bacterium]|nr:VWA domain-containing protein [Xanthomonadales bacterium]
MIEIGPLVLLRPAWLLGWLLLPWLLKHGPGEATGRGGWNTVIPARLQPLLLSGAASAGRGGWRWLLPSLLAMALLAAAGPAWDRQPLPLARSSQAQVVVFDLSPSMAAADVRPDRLIRARFKLIDWLGEQRDGQVGLVVFGGQAFAVAPLTADARTLRHLAEVLDPDLMPVPGARADLGLEKARTLLQGAGVVGGEILLITDGINRRAERLLPALRADGIRVSVLAVGTAAGAPVPREGGGFLTDRNGAIVLPRLDEARLSRFASDGGGRYAAISVDGSDLQQLAGMVEGEADYDFQDLAARHAERARGYARIGWAHAVCMCIHESVFAEIGYFRPTPSLLGFEDTIFFNDARRAGIRLGAVGDVWIHHLGSIT